jgi:hypothetical protein
LIFIQPTITIRNKKKQKMLIQIYYSRTTVPLTWAGLLEDHPGARPEDIRRLTICWCQLTLLPEWVESLVKLEILDIRDNQLIELPLAVTRLTSLKELYLYVNQLHSLPAEIARLARLAKLGIFLATICQSCRWL